MDGGEDDNLGCLPFVFGFAVGLVLGMAIALVLAYFAVQWALSPG